MENSILQLTLETLIQVLIPIVITAFVIPLIQVATAKVKASLNQADLNLATSIVRQLVLAAEQKGLKDMLFAEGVAKRDWVIAEAEKSLAAKGINLDLDEIYHILEAEVLQAFNFDKLYETDAVGE